MNTKLRHILLFVGTLLVCVPLFPATQKKTFSKEKGKSTVVYTTDPRRVYDIHHIAVWGGAGYSGLVNTYPSAESGYGYSGSFSNRFVGGGGGFIGFGYEYKYKRFLLSVGPEFRIFSSIDKMTFGSPYECTMAEYNQTKHYQFDEILNEQQTIGQLVVPVMFGGIFDKVYFKAGAKIGYTLLSTYRQQGLLSTRIIDPLAMDPWEEMSQHGLWNRADYIQKGKNTFGLDLAFSAEVGVNIDKLLNATWQSTNEDRAMSIRMRIGAFVDYGLLTMNIHTDAPFASVSEQTISTISLHRSEWASSRLNSLLVGVKFTALLQMNKEKVLKKQKPALIIYTEEAETRRALSGVALSLQPEESKKKPIKKSTNSKGYATLRLAEGNYAISATRSGYIPNTGNRIEHIEDMDTVCLSMQPVPVYTISVRHAKTRQFIASTIRFTDISTDKVVQTGKTDTITGVYHIALPIGGTYKVHIEADGFFTQVFDVLSLSDTQEVLLEPMEKKKAIVLNNLYFATNSTTILPESEAALAELYDMLADNPAIRIRIIGHTDAVGSDKDNQILSEGRANSVRQDMVKRGIDANRIEVVGKGKTEPIAPNDTEEGRAKNRRVEFVVL